MTRFAAFEHANFRRFFAGQVISSIGTWFQSLAVAWLVLDLTGRSDRLGVAVALQFLPLLLLGAPAGVLADRVDNRRLLLVTSGVSAALAALFGLVVSAGSVDLRVIYGLTFASGVVLAVERPAMQALLYQLVGPETLPSAVAANSTIVAVSRLVGPALGGVMIAVSGVGACFFANAVSFVAVFVALTSIRRDALLPRPIGARGKGGLRDALKFVRQAPQVRRPLMVMGVVGVVALNFQTTFPAMVRFGFEEGAGGVGAAMSVSAIGSILGGVYAGGARSSRLRTLPVALTGFGLMLILLAAAPTYAVFVLLGVPLGFASASFQTINTIAVQQATAPAMQGRVMALHQMALYGSTPIGALAMGWIIQTTSPRVPFFIGSVAALGCAAALTLAHQAAPRVINAQVMATTKMSSRVS